MKKRGFRLLCSVALLSCVSVAFIQCKKKADLVIKEEVDFSTLEETPVSGQTNILVDESIFPIVNDVNEIFMYEYDRIKINLLKHTEQEILNLLLNDSIRIAVLPRELDEKELELFKGRVTPKLTHFATDAIVFVTNKTYNDSVIDYNSVISNLKSKSVDAEDKTILVFDNINSSVSSAFRKEADVTEFPKDYAYYLKDTDAVIDYVSKNKNAIGVIGLNWLVQPTASTEKLLDDIKVLAVKNYKDGKYYKATQNNIAEGTYPLIRKDYVIDIQGKSGLGVGFASYIAGYKGQRIVLKSGLVPFKVPPRELNVRKEI